VQHIFWDFLAKIFQKFYCLLHKLRISNWQAQQLWATITLCHVAAVLQGKGSTVEFRWISCSITWSV